VRDITARKQAEAALKRSEERYRSIFENSPLGIFQSTLEGRFLRVNPALARILGYESPQDVIDSVLDMATQVHACPQQRAGILQQMEENDGQIICENEYLRKDGRKWIGHLTMSIINDEKGIPHHLDGIVEDVTEKRTMEEKLGDTMEQLRTLSRRLLEIQETERRYIARELHDEIGQTLTALRINLKRTERSKTGEPTLAGIIESTAMVDALINQVRNLSIELRPSILDDFGLTAALDWYIGWLSVKAEFKVAFHTDFTEERFSPILELTCFRIAQEALTNAARHSSAKNVYVDLEMLSTELHLTVRDDGKGFNVDRTHKKALEGKSFGLLGMQERATLAGGHMELTSRPGKGTVIHACFPLS
jgi:PAS domain S-box-containing protein